MDSLKKLHEIDGWKCIVEYASDCPNETNMAELLMPSRNPELSNLPSLVHDLVLAEATLAQNSAMNCQMSSCSTNDYEADEPVIGGDESCINGNEAPLNYTFAGDWNIVENPCIPAVVAVGISAPALNSSIECETYGYIPGLETPERTPNTMMGSVGFITNQGFQCSHVWQTWGSDLELASPRVRKNLIDSNSWRCSFPDNMAIVQGIINAPASSSSPKAEEISLWSPSLLDLSLNLPDISLDQQSGPLAHMEAATDNASCQLNGIGDVGSSSFSLLDSTLTEMNDQQANVNVGGIDCFSLECFGLDSSACCSFYPELQSLESHNQQFSSESLCLNPDGSNMSTNSGIGQTLHGLSPLDTFLGHTDNTSSTFSSDSNFSNGLQGMPSFSSSSFVDMGYSSTTTTGGTTTRSGDVLWNGRENAHSAREGRVTRRSAGHGTTATSSLSSGTQRQSMQRGSSERVTEITIQELSQYFNMPITQASKELKVGLTVLKKKCREFGIPRWPHRKMKSLDSLINNIQDLASEHGGKGSARVLNAVKELEEQKKLMEEMPGIELAERTKRLRQACFKASYKKRRLLSAASSQQQHHQHQQEPHQNLQQNPLHQPHRNHLQQ
ncbi:hypothetical protein KP509_11G040500 [Ceratopteris richardii]|nr:hypothetical protein KP509_11G040500 [Ceratopteris richardii]